MRESSPVNFTLYPLALLALSFASGILAGSYVPSRPAFYLPALIILPIAVVLRRRKRESAVWLAAAFFALGAFSLSAENASLSPDRLKILYDSGDFVSDEPLEITGVLRRSPELAVGGFFIELDAESAVYKGDERKTTGRIRIFAPAGTEALAAEFEKLHLGYGTRVRIACRPERADEFLNPGVASRRAILDRNRTDAAAVIKSPLLVENLGETNAFPPLAWIYERRRELITEFKSRFSVSTAGVLIASLLGNRYHLDKGAAEAFREGGTFHVLVISGLHITFIGGLAVLLLRHLTRRPLWQFAAANVFLWTYAAAVGAEPPVVRAAVMFTILHFSAVVFRRGTLLNALGATGLILLVWRPSELFNQSFQLTFLSVFAIVGTAFPLIEKLRSIGAWQPSEDAPAPPNAPKRLKTFCETLYWSEANWRRELALHVWQGELFKTPFAAKLERLKLQKLLRFVFESVLVSLVVQAWLLPFLVIYFHRVSLVSVLLNVWVGILLAIESLTAVCAVFAARFSEIFAAPFVWATELCSRILIDSGSVFGEFGQASLRVPVYTGAMSAVYPAYFLPLIMLTVLICRWQPFRSVESANRKRAAGEIKSSLFRALAMTRTQVKISICLLAVLAFLMVFHPLSAPAPDGRLRVEFLDVGQGDAIFVTFPTGETMLVDGGGRPGFTALYVTRPGEGPEPFEADVRGIGERVVSEFLWEKGYSQIDFLVATHADADHLQGLTDAARNFSVKRVFVGRMPLSAEGFSDFLNVLEKKNVPVETLGQGNVIKIGDVEIRTLFPEPDAVPDAPSGNNKSLVLRIAYGKRTFLLTGDIERETEEKLLQTPGLLRADVVKAAHHGSRTSSIAEFVRATRAANVVFSVGKDSPYGHPHREVVERWRESGAALWQTGETGTISFSTDGKDLQAETFVKGK